MCTQHVHGVTPGGRGLASGVAVGRAADSPRRLTPISAVGKINQSSDVCHEMAAAYVMG